MKPIGIVLLFFVILFSSKVDAQKTEKKPLSVNDFAAWNVIKNQSLSNDGKFLAYELNKQKGDGKLIVKNLENKKSDTIPRGYSSSFSANSDFIVYKIKPAEDSIRNAKKKKLKKELMPKDSIGILVFKKHRFYSFPDVVQYSVSKENSQWVAFISEIKKPAKKLSEIKDMKKDANDKKPNLSELKNQLVLFKTSSGDSIVFKGVSEFFYAPKGNKITFIKQTKDSLDRAEVIVFDTETGKYESKFKQTGTAKKINGNNDGNKFSFLFTTDTIKEKVYKLYYGNLTEGETKPIISGAEDGMPIDWTISEFGEISFSENGNFIFFGTNSKPRPEPKDSLLDEEKPLLDIWTWKDREMQPEQKVNLEKEKKRTYRAVYNIDKSKFFQLADINVREIRTIQKGNGKYALGIDNSNYKLESSWTGRPNSDYYLIDVETGNKYLALKNKSNVSLSPSGNYLVWYEPADSSYYSKATNSANSEIKNISSSIPVVFCDEKWDMPGNPVPYGITGFSDNDKFIFIYDRYDIWRVDLDGLKVPVNATHNYGRKNYLKLRYKKLDQEEEFIDTNKPAMLHAFDERSKAEGFFSADFRNFSDPKMLLMEDYHFESLTKSKNAEIIMWTRENVKESSDLWVSNTEFEKRRKISEINPQQNDFVWPIVKLVKWNSFSGVPLEGLLYLPETIDLNKQYPMIVYFYERNSDNLNAYTEPSPSRSTVNRSFFASNDYIVFIPDIIYREGYPGQDAFDAVISGTQFVSNMFPFVDSKKIGIQGQSWGGYQTAWLITQTDMFAAAGAGAPVSNMTSAYGGIRWESGLSRMFQYEQTQSRIGATLWEKPLHYIENSPIFYVPKIKTPLLIMHNDNDGAVPWYQGIELFTAMRRLNKPVWMLTYNNEDHNLKAESWANRMDLTIRMKQFFDHYLKGQPMPAWMNYGVPAIKKGKDLGY